MRQGRSARRGLRIPDELAIRSAGAYLAPVVPAPVHVGLGEREGMFDWLERAYQERGVHLVYMLTEPLVAPKRTDPRFSDLLLRVGLPNLKAGSEPANSRIARATP